MLSVALVSVASLNEVTLSVFEDATVNCAFLAVLTTKELSPVTLTKAPAFKPLMLAIPVPAPTVSSPNEYKLSESPVTCAPLIVEPEVAP